MCRSVAALLFAIELHIRAGECSSDWHSIRRQRRLDTGRRGHCKKHQHRHYRQQNYQRYRKLCVSESATGYLHAVGITAGIQHCGVQQCRTRSRAAGPFEFHNAGLSCGTERRGHGRSGYGSCDYFVFDRKRSFGFGRDQSSIIEPQRPGLGSDDSWRRHAIQCVRLFHSQLRRDADQPGQHNP